MTRRTLGGLRRLSWPWSWDQMWEEESSGGRRRERCGTGVGAGQHEGHVGQSERGDEGRGPEAGCGRILAAHARDG